MPRYLCVRHLLKLDILLTSVRQSWTKLHEGAAIWILGKQLNRNKTRHCERLVDRQTAFFSAVCFIYFFYISSLMCAIIEWTQSSFCTTRMDWKVAVFKKIQLACLCFPGGQAKVFVHSIAEYWALHSVYWEVTVWFFFYSGVGYMTIGITLYQKPKWVMLYANQCLEMFLFFLIFVAVDNKIIAPGVWIIIIITWQRLQALI